METLLRKYGWLLIPALVFCVAWYFLVLRPGDDPRVRSGDTIRIIEFHNEESPAWYKYRVNERQTVRVKAKLYVEVEGKQYEPMIGETFKVDGLILGDPTYFYKVQLAPTTEFQENWYKSRPDNSANLFNNAGEIDPFATETSK